jgi:hypothetical protein
MAVLQNSKKHKRDAASMKGGIDRDQQNTEADLLKALGSARLRDPLIVFRMTDASAGPDG